MPVALVFLWVRTVLHTQGRCLMPPGSCGQQGAQEYGAASAKQSSVSRLTCENKQKEGKNLSYYSLPGQRGCAAAGVLVRTTSGSASQASRARRSRGHGLTHTRRCHWAPATHSHCPVAGQAVCITTGTATAGSNPPQHCGEVSTQSKPLALL